MAETKACSLTETEIKELIRFHGMGLHQVTDEAFDRLNYLNKRLKAFAEAPESPPKTVETTQPEMAGQKAGW